MDMITGQIQYFGASFLWGAALMFAYDFILVFRCKIRHSTAGRLVEDWLFWLTAAVLVFQMIFALNNGIIRSFFVASFVGGLFLYRLLVGRRLIRLILAILHAISRPYVWIRQKVGKIRKKSLK